MSKNFDIKPTTKISKAQKAALAERLLQRQESKKAGQSDQQTPPGGLQGGLPGQMPEQMPQPSQSGAGLDLSQAKPLESVRTELPETHELAAYAAIGAQLWKDMGGMQSIGGRVWDMFRQRAASHHEDPRDYFISSYVRFQANPEAFAKQMPDEARLLAALQEQFEKSQAVPASQVPARSGPLANLPPRVEMPEVDPSQLAAQASVPGPVNGSGA